MLAVAATAVSCDDLTAMHHQMPSGAMEPAIAQGSIVECRPYLEGTLAVARGDIVTFRSPRDPKNLPHLKRVVAVGGDVLEFRDDQLFIDGQPVQADYGRRRGRAAEDGAERRTPSLPTAPRQYQWGSITVADGHVFMLGDNWDESADSRIYGQVPLGSIVARCQPCEWSSWRTLFDQ